ncbi:TPA: hypothetical protein HA265_00375 [Candidatus Woesearchaeota archaeon]|nr:hypothetical protein [Candidatus Woesearchaeota archaeon]
MHMIQDNQVIEGIVLDQSYGKATIYPEKHLEITTEGDRWTSIGVKPGKWHDHFETWFPEGFHPRTGDKVRVAASFHNVEKFNPDGSYMHRTFETVAAENACDGSSAFETIEVDYAYGEVVWRVEDEGVLKALPLHDEWSRRGITPSHSYAIADLKTDDSTQAVTFLVDVEEGQRSIEDCLGHRVRITETCISHGHRYGYEGTDVTQVLEDLDTGIKYEFQVRAHQLPNEIVEKRGWDIQHFRDEHQ